jgi:hypothetical protein
MVPNGLGYDFVAAKAANLRLVFVCALAKFAAEIIIFYLFVLNTIGNVLAESLIEKLFSVLTMILAVICCRLAIEPIQVKENS